VIFVPSEALTTLPWKFMVVGLAAEALPGSKTSRPKQVRPTSANNEFLNICLRILSLAGGLIRHSCYFAVEPGFE
jgi:hypothetical protein